MESKKIISMLAMAAVMVGCSQEELVVDGLQNATVDLSGRPVLNEVILGTGVDSRMGIKEGSAISPLYESGDQIGAALFDTPNYGATVAGTSYPWTWAQYLSGEAQGTGANAKTFVTDGAKASGFYTTQDFISSNYPFTRSDDGNFYTNAELVEGNYMFYLPYAESHKIREALNVVLPQIQDCSDEVMRETTKGAAKVNTSSTALAQFFGGVMEDFEGAMAVVGYQFLSKDNTKPAVSLEPIFAYPLITITNEFNGFVYGAEREIEATEPATATMVIDSIQVYYDGLGTNPLFHTAKLNKAIATEMGGAKSWSEDRFTATQAHTAEILSDIVPGTYSKHSESAYGLPKINPNIGTAANRFAYVGDNHVTLVLNKELANGESYSFHAVLPAANYGHDLKARVFATIDGKACVISNLTNEPVKATVDGELVVVGYEVKGFAAEKDYRFEDEVHGGEDLMLIRGEQYPKAEYVIKNGAATGFKAFCGDMMTITLANTNVAGVVTGATAFELVEPVPGGGAPVDPADKGIQNNEDFVSYMNSYIQNGISMTEDATLGEDDRNTWGAGNIAFAKNHTVVIDAALIEEIYSQVNENDPSLTALTLTSTQLGIGADVKISNSGAIYTFSTLDDSYSIKVRYNGVSMNTNQGAKLLNGINEITSQTVTLGMKDNTQNNAVVYVSGSANVTYDGATGINAIYLMGGTLNINAACNVKIIATDGNIVIGEEGSMTNALNTVANTVGITNNFGNQIAGTLADDVVVTATYPTWPEEAIAENSQINKVIVAPAIQVDVLAIEQAHIDMFANLTDVCVVLNDNVKTILSSNNVSLVNIVELTSQSLAPIKWNTTNLSGIEVSSPETVIFTKITNGTGVTFKDKITY